ncbi:hypothetical protein V5799_002213 [Amblyomma americanum]|uniref:Uncharacterized protein n=1 Tax=Amblyomma americanum TaxID=6943 RepID=A0AAQ4CXZ2_AMBAM
MDAEASPAQPAGSSARNQDGLHVSTLSLMKACYIYCSFTALNWAQHHVCNGELTVIVLLGGPSVNRVSGGTVPRILAEPYLDIQTRKMDAEATPGHLP